MSCVETWETRIDFLVQKVFLRIFLRNPQNTFPMRQATVQMESSRSFGQTIIMTSLKHRWNFGLFTFCIGLDTKDLSTRTRGIYSIFLRIPQSTFLMLDSNVQMQRSRSWAQTIPDDFLKNRWNFPWNVLCWSFRNEDWFGGTKGISSYFFAESAKHVSNDTGDSSNGIKSFFLSNDNDGFS